MRERVQAALNQVRPTLQKDGGDVVLSMLPVMVSSRFS